MVLENGKNSPRLNIVLVVEVDLRNTFSRDIVFTMDPEDALLDGRQAAVWQSELPQPSGQVK